MAYSKPDISYIFTAVNFYTDILFYVIFGLDPEIYLLRDCRV